jgi:hypothetical protein
MEIVVHFDFHGNLPRSGEFHGHHRGYGVEDTPKAIGGSRAQQTGEIFIFMFNDKMHRNAVTMNAPVVRNRLNRLAR